jgi:choice-of-anchor A domain-containing protein
MLASGWAHAQSLTATQILQQFNAVVFGNFSDGSDVQGRTVIGGNLTSGTSFYGTPGTEAASTLAGLSVYGAITDTYSLTLESGSGVTVGGLNDATLSLNGGGSVYVGAANSGAITVTGGSADTIGINGNNSALITDNSGGTIKINGKSGSINGNGTSTTTVVLPNSGDKNGTIQSATVQYGTVSLPSPLPSFSSNFTTPLTNLSTQLQGLTANSTVTASGGTATFNAAPNSSGQAIFSISSSVLTANTSIVFNTNGATTIIVDVTCGSANCSITLPSATHFTNDTTYAADTLWNFYNAGTLNFGSEFGGSVLAPDATVTNSSPIDGDLIANAFTGSAELHNYPFTGNLNFAVPEPAGIALLGVGLVGLTIIRRRRSRPQPEA